LRNPNTTFWAEPAHTTTITTNRSSFMAPSKQPALPAPPTKYNPRYDYADKLPKNVPPIELPWGSMARAAYLYAGQSQNYLYPVGPGDATYYFPVKVMPNGPNATGVFFPDGYKYPDTIDVIIYFHGHKAGEYRNINEYWSGKVHKIRLREDINDTGK